MKIEIQRNRIGQELRRIFGCVLTGCAVLGWWGAIYPQFTLLSGTYEVVCEEDTEDGSGNLEHEAGYGMQQKGQVCESEADKGMLYWQILSADRSHIRMRSKLLEDWKILRGTESEKYGAGEE